MALIWYENCLSTTLLTSVYWQHELADMLVSTLSHAPVLTDFVCKWYFIIEPSFGADQESVMLLRSILSSYGDTCGFVFSTIVSGTSAASASGIIDGFDSGTNSMLTRKIPKIIGKLFLSVTFYLFIRSFMFDHYTSHHYRGFSYLNFLILIKSK
uniref:Uncharacterized protein n=1 Tax=uncultured marine thaumarchaeote KM3_179_B04 TaxID=1456061 RepID=A0A075GPS4_9ARCH|nr:hypothetical protein [uncultured marine thaumarchaeote KM3_179_B04]